MAGLFNTLNTANKGLMTQQTALHVTGHNLTNANTPGYTRQRVEMKADLAYRYAGVGYLGTGVKSESIIRYSNDYVAKQIRQESHDYGKYTSKADAIDELEMIFNEPTSSGLNFYLGEMFDSWKELSVNPELSTSKTLVVEKSKAFTDIANHMMGQIDSLTEETHNLIDKEVMDFNATIDKIDKLNMNIHNAAIRGEVPNDLLDERDLLLKDLSNSVDFKTEFDDLGRVAINLKDDAGNQLNVLSHDGDKEELKYDSSTGKFDLAGTEVKVTSGAMEGYRESIKDIAKIRQDLVNNLEVIAEAVNTVHGAGDSTIKDLFVMEYDTDGKLVEMKIDDLYDKDHSKIQSGKYGAAVGDGSKALNISKLREIKFYVNNGVIENDFDAEKGTYKQDGRGKTMEGMYRDTVAKIGISKQHAVNMIKNQEALLNQLFLRRESESGVNLDEEVSNVIRFQRSYEANARVINVVSEMLDTLINRTGV